MCIFDNRFEDRQMQIPLEPTGMLRKKKKGGGATSTGFHIHQLQYLSRMW